MSSLLRKIIMSMQAAICRLPFSLSGLLLGANLILCPAMAELNVD